MKRVKKLEKIDDYLMKGRQISRLCWATMDTKRLVKIYRPNKVQISGCGYLKLAQIAHLFFFFSSKGLSMIFDS